MKKMKVILSLLLVFTLFGSITGSARYGVFFGDSASVNTTDGIIKNGNLTNLTVTSVSGFGGKQTSDVVYKLENTSTTSNTSTNYIYGSNTTGGVIQKTGLQFLIPDDNSQLAIHAAFYKTDGSYSSSTTTSANNIVIAGASGIKLGGSSNAVSGVTIEKNKWYNLVIVFPYNSKTVTYYLNGTQIGTSDFSATAYGVRGSRIGTKASSGTSTVYIDNVHGFIDNDTDRTYYDAYNPASFTKPVISLAEGYSEDAGVITVPNSAKVSELAAAITNTDKVRVYTDSTMTTQADSTALANGTTVVVAKDVAISDITLSEASYAYYTVVEEELPDPDADVLKGNDTGDLTIYDNTTDSTKAEIKLQAGVYGKSLDDSAYKFEKTNSGAYINYSCGHKSDTYSLLEFGFARKDENDDFKLNILYYSTSDHTNSARGDMPMYFNENGIEWGSSKFNLYNEQPFDTQKWYTVAIQFPTAGSKTMTIYINGEKIYEDELITNGGYGLAFARFNIAQGKTFYLDNIRDAQELYTPSKDAKAEISVANGVVKDNALKMLEADKTKITIGKTDILRMYKSDWSTAANLSEADFVVVAAKNGRNIERTYTYLDKEIVSTIVDYSKATSEDETTLNTKLISNEKDSTLIIAWYDDKELVDHAIVPTNSTDGIYVAKNTLKLNNSYTYRIFAWNSVDGLKPLTKATDVK